MLTNNFKVLMDLYPEGNFKDVFGDTQAKGDIIKGVQPDAFSATNARDYTSDTSRFDYVVTTATNSFTDERTKYNWKDVIATNSNTISSTTNRQWRFNGFVLFVGTGETAEAVTDFKLNVPVELSVTNASCTHTAYNKTLVTRTFQNNTASAVTVKEVGLYLFAHQGSSTASSFYPVILLGRKVLDVPVTLAVGDTYTFTYNLDFSGIVY